LSGLLGSGTPFAISIGYGEGHSTATTTLNSTTITGEDAVDVTSSAATEATSKSRTSGNLIGRTHPNAVALAVAVANTSETSHVTVSQGSSVTSKNSTVNTDATGEVTNFSWAEPTVLKDGTVALGVGVDFDKADIKTQIDGTLDGARGTSNTFNADPSKGPVAVDYTKNTIHLPDHGFTDGEAVTYSNGGAPSIGGLTDGATYYVQVIDKDNIRLANAPTLSLTYNRPAQYDTNDIHPTHTLGTLATLDFEPSGVNTNTDQITFPGPHGLADG